MRRRKLSIILFILVFSGLLAGLTQAAEFSAVTVSKVANHERLGKIYVKGDKVRQEFATGGGTTTVILRADKHLLWMTVPGQKAYMEMPVDKEAFAKALNLPEDQVHKKLLGTEKIQGYDTEKYETSMKIEANEFKSIMWISKKLEIPLRIESPDQSTIIYYRDIREGGVDDGLFEVPAGYQKMATPTGMPKMK